MTDQNTAYKNDVPNLAEDDPLAELARIVSGQQPTPAPVDAPAEQAAPVASAPANDGMDLEAELMRELGGEAVETVEAPAPIEMPVETVAQVQEPVQSIEDDLEAQLGQNLEAEMPVAVAPQETVAPANIQAVDPQGEYQAVNAAPSEMLSNLERQLQDDLAVVDKVTHDVALASQEAVQETASQASLEETLLEEISAQAPQAEVPVAADTAFIPQAPIEIAPEAAPIAANVVPDSEIDFGDAFAEQVEQISAEQALPQTELDLEQGFADAFADELDLQQPEMNAQIDEPIVASVAPSIAPTPAPSMVAQHDELFAEPESISNEAMDQISAQEASGGRGGFKLALGALGIALIAGLGVVGWGAFNGEGSSDQAMIIKADETPVKVKPKDPGGKVIANTENKVYETVSGNTNETKQESLVKSSQEPVDIAKSADRLKPTSTTQTSNQLGGVAPKRVQTLTIRQDGTIVRNEAPKPVEVAKIETPKAATPKVAATQPSSTVDGVEVLQPVTNVPENAIIVNDNNVVASTSRSTVSNEPQIVETLPLAKTLPVVETQPVATSNAPTQIAPAKPKPVVTAARSSGWSVQVSSQRSPEAAQRSYANLKKRFSSVLSSRSVDVQRANISGKGTFYRVKIPATSKSDANSMCSRLKSAGGSCFVTRS